MSKGERNRSESASSISTACSSSSSEDNSNSRPQRRQGGDSRDPRDRVNNDGDDHRDDIAVAVDKDPEIRRIRAAMKLARARQQVLRRDVVAPTRGNDDANVPVARRGVANEDELVDEVVQLKMKLSARDDEIKFLQRKMAEKEGVIRDMASKHTLSHKAAVGSLWDSLKGLETKVTDNSTNISAVCGRLERIVAGLERHSMQGHHLVGSRSAVGLFLKLREGIDEIRTLVGTTSKDTARSSSDRDSAPLGSSAASSSSSSAAADHQKADAAFLDLCRYLEDENLRLQQAHVAMQRELDAMRADAEVAALIPQYRMVIVRARAQIDELKEQLDDEQKSNKSLKHQLESAHDEIEKYIASRASRAGLGLGSGRPSSTGNNDTKAALPARTTTTTSTYARGGGTRRGGRRGTMYGEEEDELLSVGSSFDHENSSTSTMPRHHHHHRQQYHYDNRKSSSTSNGGNGGGHREEGGGQRKGYVVGGAGVRRKHLPSDDSDSRSISIDNRRSYHDNHRHARTTTRTSATTSNRAGDDTNSESFDFHSALRERQRRHSRSPQPSTRAPPSSSKSDVLAELERWAEPTKATTTSTGGGPTHTATTATGDDAGSVTAELRDREREVEIELLALDDEIALLKRKLEQAAIAHTQQIVAEVIKNV